MDRDESVRNMGLKVKVPSKGDSKQLNQSHDGRISPILFLGTGQFISSHFILGQVTDKA